YEPNVAHIIPRFPGIIREAKKHLGESVKKGDVLAVIESNQSLNPYEVKSPISGVVVKRHSTVGEYASETTDIFVVADLSKVWGEFYVFSDDFGKIDIGALVVVEAKPLKDPVRSSVSFVSKIVDEHTQSKFIRAILENPKGMLYPGAFANALVVLKTIKVDVTVERSALQRLEGREVVFVWEGEVFEARPVITGKRDKQRVEILSGLKAGEMYATGNTFLIKAEIGKAETEHAH
ncbi:MAG: efflux RND transporter periplasmic adaptor subunit, partial [Bdellovibrionales bacterium]|nr:efflux RND transporter periplasmic adaptor subunit [Bdellovibrionales bacterium]